MQLIQSWKNSLKFFYPKNVKLFTLVTLKSIVECYKVLLRYWWWFILLLGAVIIFKAMNIPWSLYASISSYPVKSTHVTKNILIFSLHTWLDLVMYVLSSFFIFIVCISTRPSVSKKDFNYFVSYLPSFCYVIFLLFLSAQSVFLRPWRDWSVIFLFQMLISVFLWIIYFKYWFVFLFWLTATSPVYIFFLMFLLDSDKRPKQFALSFYRAFKMVIYNYPLCWLFVMGFYCIGYIVYYGIGLQMPYLVLQGVQADWAVSWSLATKIILSLTIWFLKVLLVPIPVCIFANIYIKKLHEQFDVYFTKPK